MKKKVNLTLDGKLWQSFRIECLRNQTTGSREIEGFMKSRLQEWEKKGGEKK
jgi:hypothetical protein